MPDVKTLLASALAYSGGTHSVEDVEAMVADGRAHLWEGPNSIIVTQIEAFPQEKVLFVFLAAGNSAEILAMHEPLGQWAKAQGCTLARFIGRKGWERVLHEAGWHTTQDIVMEKRI